MEFEREAALAKPLPPAPYRMSAEREDRTGAALRAAGKQKEQDALLVRPVVPPAGSHAQRQARTRAAAGSTAKAQNGNRIESASGAAVGLAMVTTVTPHIRAAAIYARDRSIHLRRAIDRIEMLFKNGKREYNAMHRPVYFVVRVGLRNFPR
jgi:hypothetical protein